jgi:hypothetical protein
VKNSNETQTLPYLGNNIILYKAVHFHSTTKTYSANCAFVFRSGLNFLHWAHFTPITLFTKEIKLLSVTRTYNFRHRILCFFSVWLPLLNFASQFLLLELVFLTGSCLWVTGLCEAFLWTLNTVIFWNWWQSSMSSKIIWKHIQNSYSSLR